MNRIKRVLKPSFFVCLLLSFVLLLPLGVSGVMAQPVSTAASVSVPLYLAEGCTRPGFDTWLCILNTNPTHSYTLKVEYATPVGIVKTENYFIAKEARVTINVNSVIGPDQDVSFKMTAISDPNSIQRKSFPSDIMVERPVYFSYGPGWTGGHVNTASVTPLPTKQYFAEGTTRSGFDEYVCVLNPNNQTAKLTFNYMIAGEGLRQIKETVPPNSRWTYLVPDHIGRGKDVSLELVSDIGVVAERPMYFAYRNIQNNMMVYGGHVVTGARGATTEPRTFAFAPIGFMPGMGWGNTWVCLQNPNTQPAPVNITISTTAGLVTTEYILPPQQRTTFFYPNLIPAGYTSKDPGCFRVKAASSNLPIMVERPIYLNMEFDGISGGSVTSGDASPASQDPPIIGKLAEGHTGDGFTMWIALTGFTDFYMGSSYQLFCFFPRGQGDVPVYYRYGEEGKNSWECALWRVNNQFPNADIAFMTQGVYAERIMVFTYRGSWKGVHTLVRCPNLDAGI